jgi:hypothetical protein
MSAPDTAREPAPHAGERRPAAALAGTLADATPPAGAGLVQDDARDAVPGSAPAAAPEREAAALRLAMLTLAARCNLASADPLQSTHHMAAAAVELLPLVPAAPLLARVVRLLDAGGRLVERDAAILASDPDAVRGYLRAFDRDIERFTRLAGRAGACTDA